MVKFGFGITRVAKSCLCKIGDRYQMIDLYRDAYVEGKKCGVDVPEYFGFVVCPPGSKKKLPLESDEDWRNLVSIWEYDGGKIPIYMIALSTPTMYTFIIQQLQSSQGGPTEEPVEPLTATSINENAINVGLRGLEAYDLRDLSQPRGVDENPSKKAKTIQGASSQSTIATSSTSQPKKPRTSSSQPTRPQPSSTRQIRSQIISSRKTRSQTKQT
ncbi:hypothetical protein Cgig2_019953 [Carnegiea gigantea]|uniref:Uncharacterized protein n=1 Tax=Carnegiea gigantea TaxID=171969 RepID=A0A9Q1JL45_9CARY|nr:hypothetical protein Cgig2_019953 [Carnegiea gigantea]